MKKILKKAAIFISPLLIGVLFALSIQTSLGLEAPTIDPSQDLTLAPTFLSVLIGDSGVVPADGDLRVQGELYVEGFLRTNSIESLSGGSITSNTSFEAAKFGHYYIREDRCTSCTLIPIFVPDIGGMLSETDACDADDILVGCSGFAGGTTNTLYGTDIYKSGTTWYCRTLAKTSPITSTAFCYSPDASAAVSEV